jgi:Holliday junction resolvase RusA-like endonuclease
MTEPIVIVVPGLVASYAKKVGTWHAKDGRSGTGAYNSAGYAKWKDYARMCAAHAVGERVPFQDAVTVDIDIYKDVPASFSKKKRAMALQGLLRPITTPDLDNSMKAIADSVLTGVVIRDDKFIVEARIRKLFSDKPRVEITVRAWVAPAIQEPPQDGLFGKPGRGEAR